MIDFHSHILPKVDDGSRSVEETFNLIKEAQKAGFEGIISTSHYIENYYEVSSDERRFWIENISKNLEENNIDVEIFLGNEMYFSENIINLLKSGKACTINNSAYVLFEFPLNSKPINIYDVIYDMMSNKLIPILAHPERYSFVQKDPNILLDLIDKGVLMQSNYGSIIGQYGKNAELVVEKMLENNIVHFLGSDVHRQNTVYPRIPEILSKIESIIGKEELTNITDLNPRLVLANKRIDINDPSEIKFSFKEKMIMRKNK